MKFKSSSQSAISTSVRNYVIALFLVIPLIGCGGGGGDVGVQVVNLCAAGPSVNISTVPLNADAAAFRAKFKLGIAISPAIIGDSTTLGTGAGSSPNAVQLVTTYVQSVNPSSVVYNLGIGGYTAADHIANRTVATVAALYPKPDAVFIALGINDATVRGSELTDLETLIAQVRSYGMLPILVNENNIACRDIPTDWNPDLYWQFVRGEVVTAAIQSAVDLIDLGTPDGIVDPALHFDQLHPNGAGYQVIASKYEAWLNTL